MSQKKERVIVYVDGFNLFFGLLEAGFVNCKWLDLNKLAHNLLQPNQEIIEIKYFQLNMSFIFYPTTGLSCMG